MNKPTETFVKFNMTTMYLLSIREFEQLKKIYKASLHVIWLYSKLITNYRYDINHVMIII